MNFTCMAKKILFSVLFLLLFHQYIDDTLPAESPYLYGLHPNAEIGFLTQTSEKLFRTLLEMQPRDSSAGEGSGSTRDEKVITDTIVLLYICGDLLKLYVPLWLFPQFQRFETRITHISLVL